MSLESSFIGNPALIRQNPVLIRQNPALIRQNLALIRQMLIPDLLLHESPALHCSMQGQMSLLL